MVRDILNMQYCPTYRSLTPLAQKSRWLTNALLSWRRLFN